MLDQIYKQVLMDHYKNQRNLGKINTPNTISLPYKNPTCGDVVVLYLEIENDRIKDVKYEGDGCSISMASCSMMTELIKGKTVEEAEELIVVYTDMIKKGKMPAEDQLGDAEALSGVHKLRARHNCAMLGWSALDKSFRQHKSAEAAKPNA